MTTDLAVIKKLFLEVLAQPTAEARRAYIDAACGQDLELRNCLLEMLEAHELHATPPPDASPGSQPTKPAVPEGTFEPGTVIDRKYKIIELIGEGGMGVVYRARRVADIKMDVALKVIKPGMDSRQVLARFNIERQALAMMNHENIAKVLDAGMTEQGLPYFVMELVKGLPMTEFCDANKLPIAERLGLFAQVCSAVQHAHQKGIVHRDLKPKNILVGLYDDKPVPKVIDFGLAKALHQPLTEDSVHTRFNAFVGTWLYTAPEQALLNNLDIDTRADIYSLGVILYELLTGKTPIEKARLKDAAYNEVLRIIREEEPLKPSDKIRSSNELPSVAALRRMEPIKLQKLVRGDLDWVVMKALEKERNRRYGSASELAADVQRYLHDEPVEAGPPTLRYRLSKLLHKHRGKALIAGLLAATILLGTVVSIIGWTTAYREQVRANQQAAISKAVIKFLSDDLLSQADPAIQIRPDQDFVSNITVKQVLDRTAARVSESFADQPLVEAGIRHALGKAYMGLGDFKSARVQLERAETLRRQASGDNDPDRLSSLHELGWLLLRESQLSRAEAMLKETASRRLQVLGAKHADTCKTDYLLAMLLHAQDKKPEAKRGYEDVLARQEQVLTLRHPDTLATQRELAGVLQAQGESALAERMMLEVLELQRAVLGKEHPETLVTLNNLLQLYDSRGEYDKEEPLLVELIKISERVLGPEHPRHLAFCINHAAVYEALKQYEKALALYEKLVPILRRVSGPIHPDTLAALHNHGAVLVICDRLTEAEPMLLEAYQGCLKTFGDSHEHTRQVLASLVALYVRKKMADEAKRWREKLDQANQKAQAQLGK
jgi:non-specific serine/threonine protein kinase/serine/threonine-protein kinase